MIPSEKDYWRALILYGQNASTYKIALGKLLSNYASENQARVDMDEVTVDFIDIYLDRLKNGKPQLGQVGRKTVVEREIDAILTGSKDKTDAIPIVKRTALLDMVLQRFNTLNRNVIKRPFYSARAFIPMSYRYGYHFHNFHALLSALSIRILTSIASQSK